MVVLKLKNVSVSEFEQAFSIMKDSFPEDEYRSYDEQKDLLNNKNYKMYVLVNTEEEIIAFICLWIFESFAFIEHFAVKEKYRNHGIGTEILHKIDELLDCQICLEVELPETKMAIRRINFYKRNGYYINDNYDYVQPSYSEDKQPVPLMIVTSKGTISEMQFEKIKETLYKDVYNVKMKKNYS